ncbi:unknown [Prevotella sp. CAG:474]|nr:unknown [Prevotella sp. CAG:474]
MKFFEHIVQLFPSYELLTQFLYILLLMHFHLEIEHSNAQHPRIIQRHAEFRLINGFL